VQADGKIVSAGYAPAGGENNIVLLRLNSDGTPDNSFGGDGHILETVLAAPGMTEAYGVGRQSDGKYVTTGYAREEAAPATVDLVSVRFSPEGVRDTTWGTSGIFMYNLAGQNDRGRNMVVLPDNRVVMVGTAMPAAGLEDAMVVMLTAAGVRDNSFDQDGVKFYDFRLSSDEEFFGAALSPDGKVVAAAGYSVPVAVDGGAAANDDATLLILPVGN
jgi:uncharacterized delta-60 repeat protein